ncbi:fibril-forming collagen alpha chain-like [Amphibalanus amphitrite]|uniref:fibril-forming collagen alpha chain-like n=1 Tax=Amphibalanus amphitrite TaxID=1232801 RepID=UPI001C90A351|nr:fibril-forming collagen alpha chain-like [Amphibalanus amphitrite]
MTSRGREELLARLATFTPARWPGEPLSALECARRGWRLEAGPLLRCAACEAAVPARLPSAGRQRLRAECVSRLRRLVAEGHRAGCRWSAAPMPAGQLRPPLPETPTERRRLAEAVARLAAADVPLPADAAPLEPSLEPERSAALLTEALGSEPPHSEREMIALSYGLAGWELASNERFLRCTFGCRTWDTLVRPSPEDAAVGGQKTPAAGGDDLIQNALDECGLEELDFEMSEEPDRTEEGDTGGTRGAEASSGDEGPEGAAAEADGALGSEDGPRSLEAEGGAEERADPTQDVPAEGVDSGTPGDAGSVPVSAAESGADPPKTDDAEKDDVSSQLTAGGDGDRPASAGGGAAPSPARPKGSEESGSPIAETPASPDESQPSGSERSPEVGSASGSPDTPRDRSDGSPEPVGGDGQPVEGEGAEPVEGKGAGSTEDEGAGSAEGEGAGSVEGEGEAVGSVSDGSPLREQEGGSPVTEEGEQEEPPAVSVDDGDESVSSGRSEEGDGGSEAAQGSDRDGGSQGGDEPPVVDRCTDESSQESRSEDSSEGGEEPRTPEPSDSGAARDGVDPPSAILTTPTAAANTTPTATVTTPTASEDPSHAAETATTAALSTPIAADDTPITEQQTRTGKRPADSPTAAGSAVKRVRRCPAGPLDGHRCWCPWVAGVDGGEPGWRRAVAALSAVGQPAGERCWLGDAALDTMRRVWATLDQWTSPVAAKPALRA